MSRKEMLKSIRTRFPWYVLLLKNNDSCWVKTKASLEARGLTGVKLTQCTHGKHLVYQDRVKLADGDAGYAVIACDGPVRDI